MRQLNWRTRGGRLALALGTALALWSEHAIATEDEQFARLARSPGMPEIPGLHIAYLVPLGDAGAAPWRNIILHQSEGPAGSALALARAQHKRPDRRGVTIWVETDGTVYWATPETTVTTHGDGANRNDHRYVDNRVTYRQVTRFNSIGVEFVGNFPDVAAPPTPAQFAACLVLVRFLQERYGIPVERIYAHNWIDYKDARYCEGCTLAEKARAQGYVPTPRLLRSAGQSPR